MDNKYYECCVPEKCGLSVGITILICVPHMWLLPIHTVPNAIAEYVMFVVEANMIIKVLTEISLNNNVITRPYL